MNPKQIGVELNLSMTAKSSLSRARCGCSILWLKNLSRKSLYAFLLPKGDLPQRSLRRSFRLSACPGQGRTNRFRKRAVVLNVYSVLILGHPKNSRGNLGETPSEIGAAGTLPQLSAERRSTVFDASFELCPNSNRMKHSAEDPPMDRIQRVPVNKTA
jgi:hypothetical protein